MMNDTFSPSLVGVETFEFLYSIDGENKYSILMILIINGTVHLNLLMHKMEYNFKVLVKKYYDDTIYQEYGIVTLIR